jgi:hypothetical protein
MLEIQKSQPKLLKQMKENIPRHGQNRSIHHKFIGFMGSFQIHAKIGISWVCII